MMFLQAERTRTAVLLDARPEPDTTPVNTRLVLTVDLGGVVTDLLVDVHHPHGWRALGRVVDDMNRQAATS